MTIHYYFISFMQLNYPIVGYCHKFTTAKVPIRNTIMEISKLKHSKSDSNRSGAMNDIKLIMY